VEDIKGALAMPGTRRTPTGRSPLPVITPQAVALFEQGTRLMRRRQSKEVKSAVSDVTFELARVLGLKPWNDCPLTDCDGSEPPTYLHSAFEIEDWWRSRWLREALQDAVQARRKAEREAHRSPDQPAPPSAS
jgi:hypothetical protein